MTLVRYSDEINDNGYYLMVPTNITWYLLMLSFLVVTAIAIIYFIKCKSKTSIIVDLSIAGVLSTIRIVLNFIWPPVHMFLGNSCNPDRECIPFIVSSEEIYLAEWRYPILLVTHILLSAYLIFMLVWMIKEINKAKALKQTAEDIK